ncbi:glycosyltransferase family 2 protein [Candidatus Uhrbacteria bacterium]|nr:glycosyltransferase family 2 protein [Candidatus Uhrbacteria bacterium]
MSGVKWSVVLPAFNEEATIERAVVETARVLQETGSSFEIIVVDDGSIQPMRIDNPLVQLIRHEQNQGKGAAVRTGVLAAKGECICFLDCDLSTHPDEIKKVIPFLQTHDLIIGSRVMKESRITKPQPWSRVLAGKIFNFFVRSYLSLPFHDTQCGFKVFRSSLKPMFGQLQSRGWVFDVELIVCAQQKGFRIQEIPVEWKHGSMSRVQWSDGWNMFQELRRIKKNATILS